MTTIILAAGLSTRMGRNKLLLPYKGMPIIRHTAEKSLKASDRVIMVLGHDKDTLEEAIGNTDCEIIFNEAFMSGQISSIKCGLKAVENDDFAFIPADLPLLQESDFISVFEKLANAECVRAEYNGIPGHPIAYRKKYREKLLAFPGSMKEFNKTVKLSFIEGSIGTVFDVDTPDRYQALLGSDNDLSIIDRSLDRMGN